MVRRTLHQSGKTKMTWRSSLVLRVAMVIAVAQATVPTLVSAQAPSASVGADTVLKKRTCFRGRPRPTCDRYWLTEFGVAAPVLNQSVNHSGALYTWELGGMTNVSDVSALGAAVFAEAGHVGNGFGVRPRYRRWVGGSRSVDVAPGVAFTTNHTVGFSGHVALNFSDYAAVSLHLVSVREQTFLASSTGDSWNVANSTRPVLFAGGRLGSRPGSLTGILAPLSLVLLVLAVCSSSNCD